MIFFIIRHTRLYCTMYEWYKSHTSFHHHHHQEQQQHIVQRMLSVVLFCWGIPCTFANPKQRRYSLASICLIFIVLKWMEISSQHANRFKGLANPMPFAFRNYSWNNRWIRNEFAAHEFSPWWFSRMKFAYLLPRQWICKCARHYTYLCIYVIDTSNKQLVAFRFLAG